MTATRNVTRSFARTLVIMLFIVLIALVGYALWAWFRSGTFESTYAVYAEAQRKYITAANIPAADGNPVRRQVYMLLAEVLQVEMTNDVRIAKAKQGIAHLNDIEGQIDDIKDEADKVVPLLQGLEDASSGIGNLTGGSSMKDLVRLGKRQVEIISDIRGLSYRADYYTSEVFERIIDDQGFMTDEHKTYLNENIPLLEEQFDKRANLYVELKNNDDEMNRIAAELGYATESGVEK